MGLASLIREQQDEILESWEATVRSIGAARHLSRTALQDQLGELLEWLAGQLDGGAHPGPFPFQYAIAHASERAAEGYELSEVISEYAVLRDCIHEAWERQPQRLGTPLELRRLNQAIDDVITFTAVYYARNRLFHDAGQTLPPSPH
jgi:hypothetical protein